MLFACEQTSQPVVILADLASVMSRIIHKQEECNAQMLFNFRLAPLEQVQPWRRGDNLVLHWFGLTDGCYWIRAGEIELFRYRKEVLEEHRRDSDHCEPYVDYQVVRLWEDLLEILPNVLAPVPQILADKLTATNFMAWRARVEQWMESKENGLDDPIYEHATEWAQKRHLSSLHLQASPLIWAWNDGTYVHLEWDNRQCLIKGLQAWTALLGSWEMPVREFLEEVRIFDARLMQAMQLRVEQITTGWSREGVQIDQDKLVLEQTERSMWLTQSFAKIHQEQNLDWNPILSAVAFIDAETKT